MSDVTTLIRNLDAAARRIRTVRVGAALTAMARAMIAVASGCVLLDAAFRFPSIMRWCVLGALVAFGIWRFRKKVRPALLPAPGRVHLALELERQLPATCGIVASGVEFSTDPGLQQNPFARAVAQSAAHQVPDDAVRALVRTKRLNRELQLLALLGAVWVGAFLVAPQLAATGLVRFCAPWIALEWPARTELRSAVSNTHHPREIALPLAVDLVRGNVDEDPVWVRLRRLRGETTGPWERIAMVHQGQRRFERMVEAGADAVEFQFLTTEVETPIQRIDLREAPGIVEASIVVNPPAYASALPIIRQSLGDCTGRRGRLLEPVLAGSTCAVTIRPTSSARVPEDSDDARAAWVKSSIECTHPDGKLAEAPEDLRLVQAGDAWTLLWTARASIVFDWILRDEYQVANVTPIEIAVDVRTDQPPEPRMTMPESDQTVLQSASIPLRGVVRDDVGVFELHIDASLGTTWQQRLTSTAGDGQREVEAATTLDVSSSGGQPGDVIEIVAVAVDTMETDGLRRAPVRSGPRRLKIISDEQFSEETRGMLAAIRQAAQRAGERQRSLIERDDDASAEVRPQAEIGERINALTRMLASLRTRLQQNVAEDDATESLLDAAGDITEVAQTQSDRARDALQEAAKQGVEASESGEVTGLLEQAKSAQQEVDSEIADLSELLDRDRESFAATQRLQRVAEAIAKADMERTRAAAKTIGRSESELGSEEIAGLERAAQATRDAAQAAREAMEDLRQRAERVSGDDPERAQSLRQAAQRGESESLQSRMDQAERSTRANKMDAAQQASASALQTVQRMMQDLEESDISRAQSLKRRLATVAQALEQIIQEAQSAQESVVSLVAAGAEEGAAGSSAAARQASDVAVNAAAIADQARLGGSSLQRIVRLVERGSEAEIRAADALASSPLDVGIAQEQTTRATQLFREALDAVRQQEQRTEEQERQQRAQELAKRFTELADRQEGVWTASSSLVGVAGDRRALVEARRLSVDQERIGQTIREISDGSDDVKKSAAFVEALDVARASSSDAAEELRKGLPTQSTTDAQREVLQTVREIAEALGQSGKKKKDPFADEGNQAGGGGGGGGGSGGDKPAIPPLAELKVIRSLQQRIYDRTKSAGGTAGQVERAAQLMRRQESLASLADELRREVERQMQERAATVIPPKEEQRDDEDANNGKNEVAP